jgi:hypothetical protein
LILQFNVTLGDQELSHLPPAKRDFYWRIFAMAEDAEVEDNWQD